MSQVPAEPPPVLSVVGGRDLSEVWHKDSLGVVVEGYGPALVHDAKGRSICALVLEAYLLRSRTPPEVRDEMRTPWVIISFDRKKGAITVKFVEAE